MDLTIEPWLEGFWPVLKETLAQLNQPTESSVNGLSTSIQQLNLTTETRPLVERQISSSNRFKSDQDSVTYSAALAELTSLTLPPKPMHSLAIHLIESSEVTLFTFYPWRSIMIDFLGDNTQCKFFRLSCRTIGSKVLNSRCSHQICDVRRITTIGKYRRYWAIGIWVVV